MEGEMKMTKVYIIFGDVPRSDGDNIEAVFNTRMGAEEHIEMLERKYGDYTDYHIEEFEVFETPNLFKIRFSYEP